MSHRLLMVALAGIIGLCSGCESDVEADTSNSPVSVSAQFSNGSAALTTNATTEIEFTVTLENSGDNPADLSVSLSGAKAQELSRKEGIAVPNYMQSYSIGALPAGEYKINATASTVDSLQRSRTTTTALSLSVK